MRIEGRLYDERESAAFLQPPPVTPAAAGV
jgi:hypothetical protein